MSEVGGVNGGRRSFIAEFLAARMERGYTDSLLIGELDCM